MMNSVKQTVAVTFSPHRGFSVARTSSQTNPSTAASFQPPRQQHWSPDGSSTLGRNKELASNDWSVRVVSPYAEPVAGALEFCESDVKLGAPNPCRSSPFEIFFANITSWSSHVQAFFQQSRQQVLMLVEHRQLDVLDMDTLLAKSGYTGYRVTSHAVIKDKRPSCGVTLATKSHLGSQPQAVGSERWACKIVRIKKLNVALVVAYFPVEGVHSRCHQDLRVDIGAYLLSLNMAWILIGDFNCPPEEVSSLGWLRQVGGQIVAPTQPTISTGSTLDYAVN